MGDVADVDLVAGSEESLYDDFAKTASSTSDKYSFAYG